MTVILLCWPHYSCVRSSELFVDSRDQCRPGSRPRCPWCDHVCDSVVSSKPSSRQIRQLEGRHRMSTSRPVWHRNDSWASDAWHVTMMTHLIWCVLTSLCLWRAYHGLPDTGRNFLRKTIFGFCVMTSTGPLFPPDTFSAEIKTLLASYFKRKFFF